ncbi:MAG: outer membrane lipoprotein-sorting protein, partial [Verrucomicrobiota bacterium]
MIYSIFVRSSFLLKTLVLSAVFISCVSAQTPEEKGYEIAERFDLSDTGFVTSSVFLRMTLSDRRGRETVRELQIDTLEKEGEGNGDRSMTRF